MLGNFKNSAEMEKDTENILFLSNRCNEKEGNTISKLSGTTVIIAGTEERIEYLRAFKKKLEKWLSSSPEGRIYVNKSGDRIQYYYRRTPADKPGEYLTKDKQKMIQVFLQKSYYEKNLKIIDKEIAVLERNLKSYRDISTKLRDSYSDLPDPIKEFIMPIDMNDEDFIAQWRSVPFVPKMISEEEANFITDRGEHVRSKSELNIANTLNKMNIPYKYECPLEIRPGILIYPDFTVLDVRNREECYWEHRGMMDDREYSRHTVSRIKDYARSGIYPGKRLIITEETLKSPLGSQEIVDVIRAYFL